MKDEIILDADLDDDDAAPEKMLVVKWWEKKRWLYNLIVFLFGLPILVLWMFNEDVTLLEVLFSTLFYALFLNGCYSLGMVAELMVIFYQKKETRLPRFAKILFIIGTLVSVAETLFVGINTLRNPF